MDTKKLKEGDQFRFLEDQTLPDYGQEDGTRVTRDEIYKVLAVHEIGGEDNKRVLVEAEAKEGEFIIFHQKIDGGSDGREVNILEKTLGPENADSTLIDARMKSIIQNRLLASHSSLTLTIPKGKEGEFLRELNEAIAGGKVVKVITKENFAEELETFKNAKKGLMNKFPREMKAAMNTIYVWITPDKIQLSRIQQTDFTTMAKYGQYIYVFDHDFELFDLPEPLPKAIGEYSDSHLILGVKG